jgi:uncharacterized protein YbjT (DUF2867 family)
MTILVTGGTGTLGRHVLPLLRDAGSELRVLSRSTRPSADGIEYVTGDLIGGTGIDAAVDGVDTVLHLAGGAKGDEIVARNLVAAASRAGVKHLVHISVIGADKLPLKWLRSQVAAEQAVVGSGIPYTILRAAQFHDLTLALIQRMARLPVVPSPGGLRLQPVDSRDVAERLAELALGEPAGRVPDLAGPTVYTMRELVESYLDKTGKRRMFLPVGIPGKTGQGYRAADNLNLRDAIRGTRSWESFLTEKLS